MTDSGHWLRMAFEPLATWLHTAPGFVAKSGDGWWFVGCDVAEPDHNCLIVTLGGSAGEATLNEGLALLCRRPWPALICLDEQVAPSLAYSMMERSLASSGVLPHYRIDLAELIVGDTQISAVHGRVTDPIGFREVMTIFASAFTRPMYDDPHGAFQPELLADSRLTFRLARLEGTPASALVTWRRNEIVYVTVMATDPSFQGRGLGRTLLERALIEERATGARFAHLVSSEAGARLYRSVGFKLLASHPLWTYQPAS